MLKISIFFENSKLMINHKQVNVYFNKEFEICNNFQFFMIQSDDTF